MQEWPSFTSPLLRAVSEALRARRKSLRHHVRSFTISCEREINPTDPPERVNVDIETPEERPTQIRLSVWPDGALWFRVCQRSSATRGWMFMFAFHGQLHGPSCEDLLAWLEQSLALVHGPRPSDCAQRLLSLWVAVDPVVERQEGH